jgi:hypothetical protein
MCLDYEWIDTVDVRIFGAARDEVTDASGATHVADESSVFLETDGGVVAHAEIDPEALDHRALVGISPRQGFRRRVRNLRDDDGGTLALLLDDLPAALVVAGYVLARQRLAGPAAPATPPSDDGPRYEVKVDRCAGWRADGTMIQAIHANLPLPFMPTPPVPRLADDCADWPGTAVPAPGLRRSRRIDVRPDGSVWQIDAWFRDTYIDESGECSAVHEYTVEAAVDATDRTIVEIEAIPHALPWHECPAAAAGVRKLVGEPVENVRGSVPELLRGIECCTHLNNELRALADVAHLMDAM